MDRAVNLVSRLRGVTRADTDGVLIDRPDRAIPEDLCLKLTFNLSMRSSLGSVRHEPIFLKEFGGCKPGICVNVEHFFQEADAIVR